MSVLSSITRQLTPMHREGYIFIAAFFVVALLLGYLWTPLMWAGFVMTAWCAYFFRDPKRVTPLREGLVISPADGVVSMPLEKQMWGDEFGMCTDQFGIPWMVNIAQPQE